MAFFATHEQPALLKCQTQKIKWYYVVGWVSWNQILCTKSLWYWRRTGMKSSLYDFAWSVLFFFLATFNIFGYLLAFGGREDPKVLQWLCKSLHSLWFQDLIKKLLVIDRTKRIGNLKVFFIFIGNQKVLKYISSFCVCNVQLKDLNVGSLPFSCLINDNFKSFVETFRFIARLAILSYLKMFCNHKRNNIHIYCLHRLEQRMWRGTNGSRGSTGRTSITGLSPFSTSTSFSSSSSRFIKG